MSSSRGSGSLSACAHHLHDEDVLAVDLADGDGDAHVGLVEDGGGLDRGEGGSEKKLGSDGVVVAGLGASVLTSSNLPAEVVTRNTTLGAEALKLGSGAAGVLEDTALRNANGDLAGGRNTHSLHHLLDTDSVDCGMVSWSYLDRWWGTYLASG